MTFHGSMGAFWLTESGIASSLRLDVQPDD